MSRLMHHHMMEMTSTLCIDAILVARLSQLQHPHSRLRAYLRISSSLVVSQPLHRSIGTLCMTAVVVLQHADAKISKKESDTCMYQAVARFRITKLLPNRHSQARDGTRRSLDLEISGNGCSKFPISLSKFPSVLLLKRDLFLRTCTFLLVIQNRDAAASSW